MNIVIIGDEYVSTMDIIPQQEEGLTRIHQFFTTLKNEGVLSTGKCRTCGHISWPPRIMCPVCTSDDLAWVRLSSEGVIKACSGGDAVALRGFELPSVHAIVQLDGEPGVRVFTRLVGIDPLAVQEGMRVRLKVVPASRERVVFAFEPL